MFPQIACFIRGIVAVVAFAFIPMVAESFGGWHSSAELEVKKLGTALARHTGQEEGEAVSHFGVG